MNDAISHSRWGLVAGAMASLVMVMFTVQAGAVTTVETVEELDELCALGAPTVESDDVEKQREYHQQRRRAVHQVYEVALPELDEDLMDYDRVSGLLTLSGFAGYRPPGGGPLIRLRNPTMPRFDVDEQRAHDLMAKIRMGTVQARIGFTPAAREDYELEFCTDGDGAQPDPELHVDLLYVRLVDRERGSEEGGKIIANYQTRQGHRWMLTHQNRPDGVDGEQIPEVEISHLQWRPEGKSWEHDVESTEELEAVTEQLVRSMEQTLYPCYIQALSTNASLQGAVVLEVSVGEAGFGSPKFLMDTMQTGRLRGCIDERIEELPHAGSVVEEADVDALKATILMRRR